MVVPGITSAFAAAEAIGIPITMRGVASSVAVTTAQTYDWERRIRSLVRVSDTLIVLMVRSRLREVAAVIADASGRARPAAVISNATRPDQRSVVGSVADIARLADEASIEAPATLIVGDVVSVMTASELIAVAR